MYFVCLGEVYCHGPCLAMFHFSIHTMFHLEHPFAKNKFPTLGKIHQRPNVVGNKIIILFLHNNLSFFAFSLFNFFHTLGLKKKKLWWHVHLFGGNPPIMKPLLGLFLKPFFLSILLWFIQCIILWWNKLLFQKRT